jgi:hypothetical protein
MRQWGGKTRRHWNAAPGAPSPDCGAREAMSQLSLWSPARAAWVSCPPDEITWLDRATLSGNSDVTLHRAPRCAGLRYVHHRWELFSRDTSYRVYLAPQPGPGQAGPAPGTAVPAAEVRRAARHVLPVAPAKYESLGVPIEPGTWLVSVGDSVVALRLDPATAQRPVPPPAPSDPLPPTQAGNVASGPVSADAAAGAARAGGPRPDAAARVRTWFARNATARQAMAYYYREFILGLAAPQPVPMMEVVIALNLSNEGAVSDYKKLLQGFIWRERGHARDLAGFLLANGLLTPADLDEARQVAAANERNGVCEMARRRLAYRPKA